MGRKAKASTDLGRAFRNAGTAPRTRKQLQERHTRDMGIDNGAALSSVIERNALDEFLATALLEQKTFTAERGQVVIVDDMSDANKGDRAPMAEIYDFESLPIPRRPFWTTDMSRDELDKAERMSFLDWRRDLALMAQESKLVITPYEKNLEVWRQLWRVIERSDLVVQIVDSRNPLLFLCNDLDQSVADLSNEKRTLLLVNKADYLSEFQRQCWADYFESRGIQFVFFSAKIEQDRQEREAAELRALLNQSDDEDLEMIVPIASDEEEECDEELSDEELNDEPQTAEQAMSDAFEAGTIEPDLPVTNLTILNSSMLMDRLVEVFWNGRQRPQEEQRITVGLCGYPNVGKSSIINALMGEKKVGVAAMPGKTSHFQTLLLNDEITLCDCPGLVFPTFMNSQADLVCNGILPIDRLKNYEEPTALVCKRVEKVQYENLYGLRFPVDMTILTGHELLCEFARVRGLVTGRGLPDEAMAARSILKDYSTGKLLYCHPPPNANMELYFDSLEADSLTSHRKEKPPLIIAPAVDGILASTVKSLHHVGMAFTGSSKGNKKAYIQARARAKAHMRGKNADETKSTKAPKGGKKRNVVAVGGY